MNKQNIELHIEELVLQGLDTVNSQKVADAMERELTHLLTDQGLLHSIRGEIDSCKVMEFNVTQGSNAQSIGMQVARTVYGGLKR